MIEQVIIKNYKSIRDLTLPLNKLNVLIGSNGAGKSNFISFFELTKAIYEQRLGSYTLAKGGIDNLLYRGRKISPSMQGLLDFENTNAFFYEIKPAQSNKGYIPIWSGLEDKDYRVELSVKNEHLREYYQNKGRTIPDQALMVTLASQTESQGLLFDMLYYFSNRLLRFRYEGKVISIFEL